MRLIDIDKHFKLNEAFYRADIEMPLHRVKIALENSPTVEAIPIEWIKNWCIENYPTYPRIITEELLKKTETWRMIEEWEKENARD